MIGEKAISRLGARKAVLNDLSPAATFIAYNYNTPVDARAFEREAKRILKEVEKECGWMYETWHPHCDDPNRVKGKNQLHGLVRCLPLPSLWGRDGFLGCSCKS